MTDTITDPAELMVAPLIGNILVMINKASFLMELYKLDMLYDLFILLALVPD